MNFLHLQIPIKKTRKDQFLIEAETLGQFMKFIDEKLGENWTVIASPCTPSLLSDSDFIYNFDMKSLTKKQLMDLIKV